MSEELDTTESEALPSLDTTPENDGVSAPESETAPVSRRDALSAQWDKQESDNDPTSQISDPSEDSVTKAKIADIKPTIPSIRVPKSWSKEASSWLTAEPKTLEEAVELRKKIADYAAQRQEDADRDYTSKTEQLAKQRLQLEQIHAPLKPVYQMLEPHLKELRLNGVDPKAWLDQVMEIDRLARSDKNRALAHLAQMWGVNPQELVASQGNQALPPQVHQVLTAYGRKIQELEGTLTAKQRAEQDAVRSSVQSAISSFIGATDEQGEPKHRYYEQVESLMTPLVVQMRQANPDKPAREILEEAYEQATWAHPEVRQEILASSQRTKEERERQEAAKRVAEAKRAAPPVSAGPNGKAVSAGMSRRELLSAIWDEQNV